MRRVSKREMWSEKCDLNLSFVWNFLKWFVFVIMLDHLIVNFFDRLVSLLTNDACSFSIIEWRMFVLDLSSDVCLFSTCRTTFMMKRCFFYLIIKCMQSKDYDTVLIIQINSCFLDTLCSVFVRIDLINQIFSQSDWCFIIWTSQFARCFNYSFDSFSSESSRIHLLVTISMSIRNFPKFSMFFFVSKSVLSVVNWDFIWLIIFDRSMMKWWQFNNKCFEVWLKFNFRCIFLSHSSTIWQDTTWNIRDRIWVALLLK